MKNKDLKRRIIEISYKHKLSHLGSCLTAVDIIDEIYRTKNPDDKFVLSSGHAGLALYVVLEKYESNAEHTIDAKDLYIKHGVHPNRDLQNGIWVSSGSLGNGLPIALGMALADRNKNVYCLISDGECAEGSIWEAMRIKEEKQIGNLKVYLNWNGWGAYRETAVPFLTGDVKYKNENEDKDKKILYENTRISYPYNFDAIIVNELCDYPLFLKGQGAHYTVMNETMYNEAMEVLK